MSSLITNIINDQIFSLTKEQIKQYIQNNLELYQNTLNSILKNDNTTKMLNILFEYICVLNYFYRAVGLLIILNSDPNEFEKLNDIDQMIEKYIFNFYSNKYLYDKLTQILPNLRKIEEITTVEYLLKKFLDYKTKKVINLCNEIKNISSQIKEIIDKDQILTPNDLTKKYIGNGQIVLNHQSYNYFMKTIKDSYCRGHIEKKYQQKAIDSLDLLAKLLILRHQYVQEIGFNHRSYFEYKKNKILGETDDIKNMINDIIVKIETKSRKEMERIQSEMTRDGIHKKIDNHDVIYYQEKLKSKINFKPIDVLNLLFDTLNKYFGIKICQTKYSNKLWHPNVLVYQVFDDENMFLGYLFLDIEMRKTKSITTPLFTHLSQQFKCKSNVIPSKVVLIAGYQKLDEPCMTYSDVAILFREFGNVIQFLSYSTTKGSNIMNYEFLELMPKIMEHIAWEQETIKKLCFKKDVSIVDHILFTRTIDLMYTIKIQCIGALFDHMIHASEEILIMIKQKNENKGEIIKKLYQQIYNDVMATQSDIVNFGNISPNVIYDEINGMGGMVYNHLLIEILSYTVFFLVKKGHGKEFMKTVLENQVNGIRKNLHNFISKFKIDTYSLYVKNVFEHNFESKDVVNKTKKNINMHISESSTNYFTDESENSDNSENIIQIDRKINFG